MALPSDTVVIPLIKGVDLNTEDRLIPAPTLMEAVNIRYSGGGTYKRKGHVATQIRTEQSLFSQANETEWVYGWGWNVTGRPTAQESALLAVSQDPNVGALYGVAQRDFETVCWSGHSLLSYMPSQVGAQVPASAEVGNATIPSLRATPFAKSPRGQTAADTSNSGKLRCVVWNDGTGYKYSLFDSTTGAAVVSEAPLVEFAGTGFAKTVALGNWIHIFFCDNTANNLWVYSIHDTEPNTVTKRSLGECHSYFDVYKAGDGAVVIAQYSRPYITLRQYSADLNAGYVSLTYTPSVTISGLAVTLSRQGVGYVLAFCAGSTAYAVTIDATGTAGLAQVAASGNIKRITVAPRWVTTHDSNAFYDVYFDDDTDSIYYWRYYCIGGWPSVTVVPFTPIRAYHLGLASQAFTVGDRTFVWAGHNSTLQSTWVCLDESLRPVGKLDFGVANVVLASASNGFLASANYVGDWALNTTQYNLALTYKLRVQPAGDTTVVGTVFTEPSIKVVEMDFLPKLRTAQAGRALYFAGAQLWSYDGKEMVEAGFHWGPELATPVVGGGASTLNGTYSYRVDLCYRNAQNEEVRSLSILTTSVSPSNQTVTLTIPTVLTRRANAYFLIYRNAMSSGVPLTEWWLLNSRDPADPSFLKNDQSVATLTVVDNGSVGDALIQTREVHPASVGSYLQPVSAPACEIVTAGRDRLWLAGGELYAGQVAPSRLFEPGEVPTFNPYLNIQVDRSAEPMTAVGFVGEVAIFFRKHSTYILDSDGPDNTANGSWVSPRLALADLGAQSQESLALISAGLLFQSPAGIRVMGPGGALQPIGVPVDNYAKGLDIRGAVVNDVDQEVRWYGPNGTLIYSYLYDSWATWTCSGVGAVRLSSGKAALARSDGYLWVETDNTWTDGGLPYAQRIRLPWLHGGNLQDFQRVRAVGALGRYADLTQPNHTVRVEYYYDDRDFWEERMEWAMPDSATSNTDTWGANTWGAGVWGDTTGQLGSIHDNTWEWVRKPNRQKCSAISIAIEDASTQGPGFVCVAVSLKLARKEGLNRTPARGGSTTHR